MSNWQNKASRESGTFTVSFRSQAPAKRAFKTSRLHFEVGKKHKSLSETGWQKYATDCQTPKGINKIMLTLKNCLTKQEKQPLLI